MLDAVRRPPYDRGVAGALQALADSGVALSLTADRIAEARAVPAAAPADLDSLGVHHTETVIAGYEGAPIRISVFASGAVGTARPLIMNFHGGGMVSGNRFDGISQVLSWAAAHSAVTLSVEYRLAPEHPDPVPVEDCFAALVWAVDHADELGIDRERIVVMGGSAGGGLAAGTALLARDRGGPQLRGQMLICPMLDDRDSSVSSRQYEGIGIWDRASNIVGWTALLGDRRGTDDASIYAAPARAADLSGLPSTYIDVGSAEVFRDEDVQYAARLCADGVNTELHMWPGGTHGWELLIPDSAMAALADQTRRAWLATTLE